MGTGWRRAFCTSIRRDPETASPSVSSSRTQQQQQQQQEEESPRSWVNLSSIFSGASSNPATPRGLHPDGYTPFDTPKLQCKTTVSAVATPKTSTTPKTSKESPRIFQSSSSPRSPSRFALFKTALRLSRNRCGICGESVRQRTAAVFTAECSHAFHFPCISSHVRTQGSLACPVCSAAWHEVPLLSSAAAASTPQQQQEGETNSSRRERERDQRSAAAATTKIYDDDESLQLSPTSRVAGGGLQFNPIPEELEEEEEEDEDGVDEYCHQLQREGRGGNVKERMIGVIPESVALVSTGRNHISYVISIKIKAPQLPLRPQKHFASSPVVPPGLLDHPSCRAPIDLVTVLDVSGGMTVAKLQMLKRAMRMVISSLGPGDRLCIVAFSMVAAKRLLPLRRMSCPGLRSARQIVDRLVICGSSQSQGHDYSSTTTTAPSCVGDALRKATKVLEDRRERNPVATIMLLSDGQTQNVCETRSRSRNHPHQPSSATRFAHIEIPIHASGELIRDNKQQNQRTKSYNNNMPVAGEGEEENPFAMCVNGLVSVVLQDVHLQFRLPSGGGVISSVYSYGECDDGGIVQAMSHGEGGKSVCIGDLYAEEERQLLVELKVPKATVVSGHAMSMSVVCSYRDPLTRNVIHCGERPLIMPMPMPVMTPLDQSKNKKHTLQSDQQYHLPMPLRSLSSSSSSSAAAAAAASSSIQQQEQQQQLRNLFVTTRAMAESRRLVNLSDMDTALHLLCSARSLLLQQSSPSNTRKKLVHSLEAQLEDIQRRRPHHHHHHHHHQQQQQQQQSLSPMSLQRSSSEQALLLAEARGGGGGEPLTPTSAWRAAEKLAKVAIMRKSLNRVSDLHGFENARF